MIKGLLKILFGLGIMVLMGFIAIIIVHFHNIVVGIAVAAALICMAYEIGNQFIFKSDNNDNKETTPKNQ